MFEKELQAMRERDLVTPSDKALAHLYRPEITRKVTPDGININGNHFVFPNWLQHLGESVYVEQIRKSNYTILRIHSQKRAPIGEIKISKQGYLI